MNVDGVSATEGRRTVDAGGAVHLASPLTGRLGSKEFLRLLVTELQHQNPLEPLQDRDFLAQLAQFSTLDALHRVEGQLEALQSVEAELQALGRIEGQLAVLGRIEAHLAAVLRLLGGGESVDGARTVA